MRGSEDAVGELLPQAGRMTDEKDAYRWTGEFADPQLEDTYLRASWTEIHARLGAVLIAISMRLDAVTAVGGS